MEKTLSPVSGDETAANDIDTEAQQPRGETSAGRNTVPNNQVPNGDPELPTAGNDTTEQSKPNTNTTTPEEFDEYGAELQPEARVWKTYMKEADSFDTEKVDGWNRSLDVTLSNWITGTGEFYATFQAALFTAICTAFVIESAKSLKEDTAETAARRLDQITKILLVAYANDSSPLDVAEISAPISPVPFKPRRVDVCVNALWFFSLILSAAVALLAILAKEWCYLFMSGRSGDLWIQTQRRQQRWKGIQTWRMEQLIIFLPSFIHLSFMSFAIGLCIYLGDLNWRVAILVSIVTLGSGIVYTASTIFPFIKLSNTICPYSTSISRLIQRIKSIIDSTKSMNKQTNSIAVEALVWLINTSEDPKSTDTALQAIAGADPEGAEQTLLKDSNADKMVAWRLIGLDSYSPNYKRVSELYTRALSFFSPTVAGESASGQQKNINGELQKTIRSLRDLINRQIIEYTSSDGFLPTTNHIQALRIGSTAASHCLRTLTQGEKTQTQQQFDAAIKLLEDYRNGQHLNDREIDYLMKGTAMLLFSLFIDTTAGIKEEHILRLLRLTRRVENSKEQQQLRLKYLGLPLIVYALSRHGYPDLTQPPSASPVLRAERAIEVIAYYVSNPGSEELPTVAPLMTNLGLLELLSDQGQYQLEDEDIVTISEAFDPNVQAPANTRIHTFPPNSYPYISTRTVQSIATMVSSQQKKVLKKETAVTACLTVLNRAVVNCSLADTSSVEVYAFVIECVLTLPSSTPEAYGPNSALDLMQKFYASNSEQTRTRVADLAKSLEKRKIFQTLKSGAELPTTGQDSNFPQKLFAIGQTWYLIDLAIKSETTGNEYWRRGLSSFVEEEFEGSWDTLDPGIRRFEEQRDALARRYRGTWNDNPVVRRHEYLRMLHELLPPAEDEQGNLLVTDTQ